MASGIDYHETPEFQSDLKRLLKKYRTLREDLETAKRAAIELYHLLQVDNHSVFPIPGGGAASLQICKLRKFACKALKGKGAMSGIRVIYAYHAGAQRVDFIEIYYKGNQADEDWGRVEAYLRSQDAPE